MSPYFGAYLPGDEENVPILVVGRELGLLAFAVGPLWAALWFALLEMLGLNFLVLPWVISAFLFGIAVYFVWCKLLLHRYGNPLDNQDFDKLLERARREIGYAGKIQVWEQRSERPILVSLRTGLCSAVMVSKSALGSILKNPRDGEISLAHKIASLSSVGSLSRFLCAGTFFAAANVYLPVAAEPAFFLSDPVLEASLMLLSLAGLSLFVFVLGKWVTTPYPTHRVENVYNAPIAASLMVLFLKPSVPTRKVQDYVTRFRPIPRERSVFQKRRRLMISLCVAAAAASVLLLYFNSIGAVFQHVERLPFTLLVSLVMGGVSAAVVFGLQTSSQLLNEWQDILSIRTTKELREDETRVSKAAQDSSSPPISLCSEAQAAQIETLLTQAEGYRDFHVRCVDTGEDERSLVVFGPGGSSRKDWVCSIPEEIHKIISDTDMLVPYIIYGSTAQRIQWRQLKYFVPCLIISVVLSFTISPMLGISVTHTPADPFILSALFLMLTAVVAYFPTHRWYKSSMFRLDSDLAGKYPGHMAALRILAEAGGLPELGPPSVGERLRHLEGRTSADTGN